MDANPLWVAPPDDAYTPCFEEFQSKWAANVTGVEDIILCKTYAAILEDHTFLEKTKLWRPFRVRLLNPLFSYLWKNLQMENSTRGLENR